MEKQKLKRITKKGIGIEQNKQKIWREEEQ